MQMTHQQVALLTLCCAGIQTVLFGKSSDGRYWGGVTDRPWRSAGSVSTYNQWLYRHVVHTEGIISILISLIINGKLVKINQFFFVISYIPL